MHETVAVVAVGVSGGLMAAALSVYILLEVNRLLLVAWALSDWDRALPRHRMTMPRLAQIAMRALPSSLPSAARACLVVCVHVTTACKLGG